METEFKITLLVGLPGSGKTHLGNQMAEDDENTIYLDDLSIHDDALNDIRLSMGLQHIVISDVFLCHSKDRENAEKMLRKICREEGFVYKLEWIFFENNPDKCLKNVAHRNKHGDTRLVDDFIKTHTKTYTIPEGVVPKEIWSPDV